MINNLNSLLAQYPGAIPQLSEQEQQQLLLQYQQATAQAAGGLYDPSQLQLPLAPPMNNIALGAPVPTITDQIQMLGSQPSVQMMPPTMGPQDINMNINVSNQQYQFRQNMSGWRPYQTLKIDQVIRYDQLDKGFILRASCPEVANKIKKIIKYGVQQKKLPE